LSAFAYQCAFRSAYAPTPQTKSARKRRKQNSPAKRGTTGKHSRDSLTKRQAVEILEFIAELAYKNAKNSFTLPGLGKLVLVNRKARVGRNPATGATIQIKAIKGSNRSTYLRLHIVLSDAFVAAPATSTNV